jgi:hypothetical protein
MKTLMMIVCIVNVFLAGCNYGIKGKLNTNSVTNIVVAVLLAAAILFN